MRQQNPHLSTEEIARIRRLIAESRNAREAAEEARVELARRRAIHAERIFVVDTRGNIFEPHERFIPPDEPKTVEVLVDGRIEEVRLSDFAPGDAPPVPHGRLREGDDRYGRRRVQDKTPRAIL